MNFMEMRDLTRDFFFCEMLVLVLLFLASGVTTHVSGILYMFCYIQIGKSLYDNCTSSLYSIMITYWDGPYLPYLSTYLFAGFNPFEKYACQIGPSPEVRFKIQNV